MSLPPRLRAYGALTSTFPCLHVLLLSGVTIPFFTLHIHITRNTVLLQISERMKTSWSHVAMLKLTDISEVHNASIIALMMEAVCTSET
jgi:hypothetical protein